MTTYFTPFEVLVIAVTTFGCLRIWHFVDRWITSLNSENVVFEYDGSTVVYGREYYETYRPCVVINGRQFGYPRDAAAAAEEKEVHNQEMQTETTRKEKKKEKKEKNKSAAAPRLRSRSRMRV